MRTRPVMKLRPSRSAQLANGGTVAFAGTRDLPPELAGARILSEREAAAFVGLSVATMERKRTLGRGPRFVRLSERRLGYRVNDLVEWLAERASASHEPAITDA